MLSTLIRDLIACGHDVGTCLDDGIPVEFNEAFSRVSALDQLTVDHLTSEADWLESWIRLAKDSDRTFVIAPELDGHLIAIANILRGEGANVILSTQEWLERASDKWLTACCFTSSGINQPKTWMLDDLIAQKEMQVQLSQQETSNDVVMKRRDGAGGVGTRKWKCIASLGDECTPVLLEGKPADHWIVQEWIEGQPASLAALVCDEQVVVLGSFTQSISVASTIDSTDGSPIHYLGGRGPIQGITRTQVERFAKKILKSLGNGARGWIGIDFIIPKGSASELDWFAIEVNPRLTTSYLGYRQWYGSGLADLLVEDSHAIHGMNRSALPPEYCHWPEVSFTS